MESSVNSTVTLAESTADNDILFERKIEDITSGLIPYFHKLLYRISTRNALTIASYISSMRIEVNPSDHYRRDVIKILTGLSISCILAAIFIAVSRLILYLSISNFTLKIR